MQEDDNLILASRESLVAIVKIARVSETQWFSMTYSGNLSDIYFNTDGEAVTRHYEIRNVARES